MYSDRQAWANSVDPDQMPQNACKNLHWNGDVFNQRFVISPSAFYHKRQNLTALASEDDLSLHKSHILLL